MSEIQFIRPLSMPATVKSTHNIPNGILWVKKNQMSVRIIFSTVRIIANR